MKGIERTLATLGGDGAKTRRRARSGTERRVFLDDSAVEAGWMRRLGDRIAQLGRQTRMARNSEALDAEEARVDRSVSPLSSRV
jgi:hypothetical protein